MNTFQTQASSVNRALDQIGDKWCLLLLQEIFWGTHSYKALLDALGISRGVLSNRLSYLGDKGFIRKDESQGARRPRYHLSRKSVALYDCALMAVAWEHRYYMRGKAKRISLLHKTCGKAFTPQMQCNACQETLDGRAVDYEQGPGTARDIREKRVRRRSTLPANAVPSERNVYRNLVNLVGDRWTANIIALMFRGHNRYDQLIDALPVATNVLASRLRLLQKSGIVRARQYQDNPPRKEYPLTSKGWALYPWFVALLQWGDEWCDEAGAGRPVIPIHRACSEPLRGVVVCDQCEKPVTPEQVSFHFWSKGT